MAAAATIESIVIVRYCRERKASAPSRIASEIARISGVPVSAASTWRLRNQATASDARLMIKTVARTTEGTMRVAP